jgi:hypothetical protein
MVISFSDFEYGAPDLQEVALFQSGALTDPHGVHPGAVGGAEILRPDVPVEAEQAGVQVRRVGVVVDGHAAARSPAHRDLVADVVAPARLVLRADDVQTKLLSPPALPVDDRIRIGVSSAATTLQRSDLHPHRPYDPHEEQPQENDHAVLQRSEYRCVVGRCGEGDQ